MLSQGAGLSLLITGGTGFVGQALVKRLGDQPVRLAKKTCAIVFCMYNLLSEDYLRPNKKCEEYF